jgi:iron complex transport system permease protein
MKKPIIIISALLLLSLIALFLAPGAGMTWINPLILFRPEAGMDRSIFINLRIPRVLTAYLAGSALALSGMAFQSVFRNPLATPFTLGVSSGAALGAALYIRLGLAVSLFGISGLGLAAFTGAILSITMVYGLTRLKGGFSTATLLLAGVAVSFFFSSLILFIQYLSEYSQSFKIVRWMMGGMEIGGYGPAAQLAFFTLIGSLILFLLSNELNLLMTGDDIAISRGVNAPRVKRLLFFAVSLMVGAVVAYCGPIGFVGMMVPHICRLIVGPNHRILLPASLLFGGLFLVACDTFARSIIPPAEIPTGVITALLGGPFFIALLMNKKGNLEL